MEIDIYKALFGVAVSTALWFLKSLISETKAEIKALENKVSDNKTSIEVLKNDHSNLEKKLDEISKGISEINLYIRNLNK